MLHLAFVALALSGCPGGEGEPDPLPPLSHRDLAWFPPAAVVDGWLAWAAGHRAWTWQQMDGALDPDFRQWWSDYRWSQEIAAETWALLRAAQVESQPEWSRREWLGRLRDRLDVADYRGGAMPLLYRPGVFRWRPPEMDRRSYHAEGALGLGWLWNVPQGAGQP